MATVRARFRPHARGFGFATVVGDDGVTPAPVQLRDDDGAVTTVDSVFVPPPLISGRLLSDDLVSVEAVLDDKGATAMDVTLVERPRQMVVGRLQQGAGTPVLDLDPSVGAGWMDLGSAVTPQLRLATGRQAVVLIATDEEGAPVGRALVAGPHVVGSPSAVRARTAVAALGGAAPTLVPGGAVAAGLDPAGAALTHTRVVGLVATGARGAASGLDVAGTLPGAGLVRIDRSGEPAVTIDDAGTRDVDDAVTAAWDGQPTSTVAVSVHIADVAGTVGVDSPADTYARTVATTVYPVTGDSVPMLDPALSEDALSLLPGVDRPALSVSYEVDPTGALLEVAVEACTVRSDAKLSYATVQAWLDGDAAGVRREAPDADHGAVDGVLDAAAEAARRLGVARDARATIEELFTDPELEPIVVDGRLRTREAEPHAQAYRLIERLMVAANESVAAWLQAMEVPALFRSHVGLDPERLDRLEAAAELAGATLPSLRTDPQAALVELLGEVDRLDQQGLEESRDLLVAVAAGSVARASYTAQATQHQALAASAYTHFTSPIRRYADLVVHRQIRATLAGEPLPHAEADLAGLARWLDVRAGAVSRFQARERAELWDVLLDRGVLDGPEPGVVTAISANGLTVRLPRLSWTGFVTAERALGVEGRASLDVDEHRLTTTSGPWRVGARVPVRVLGLDPSGRITLRLGATASAV